MIPIAHEHEKPHITIMNIQNSFEKALTSAIHYVELMTECRVFRDKDFGLVISGAEGYATIPWGEVMRAYSAEDFSLELLATYEAIIDSPFEV